MSSEAARGIRTRGAVLAVAGVAVFVPGVVVTGLATEVALALIVVGAGLFTVGVVLPQLTSFRIGASGFEATLREPATQERLAHLAAWLQGDPAAAPRALADATARAQAAGAASDPYAEVVRRLVEAAPPAQDPPPPVQAGPVDEARTLLAALRGLAPERRGAVLLDLLGDAGSEEAARILGRTRENVEQDVAESLSRLPGLIARAAGELA